MKYISTYDYVERWGRFYIPIVVETSANRITKTTTYTTMRFALTNNLRTWVYKSGPTFDNEYPPKQGEQDNFLPSPLDTKLGKALYEI